jgi:hypothetical protein
MIKGQLPPFTNHSFEIAGVFPSVSPIKCKYCNLTYSNYNDYIETMIFASCISENEKIIKDLLE